MNELTIPASLPSAYELGELGEMTNEQLREMTNEQLRTRIIQTLTLTARTLVYVAALWSELEKRGGDLSDLRIGIAEWMPLIAAKQVDPELVVRFVGQPSTLRLLSTQPLAEQHRLARGAPVQVLALDESGQFAPIELPATSLTPAQARAAFDLGRPRPIDEQIAVVQAKKMSAYRRPAAGADPKRVRYDKKTDTIRIGRCSATVGEVLGALGDSADIEPLSVAEQDVTVLLKFSESEKRRISVAAAESGKPQQHLLRELILRLLPR